MEVGEIEGLLSQVVRAVDGESGDVKTVGVKVDGVELEIAGLKGEKTTPRGEAVGQTSMAHDKKFIQIEARPSKFESENQGGGEGQAKRRSNMAPAHITLTRWADWNRKLEKLMDSSSAKKMLT